MKKLLYGLSLIFTFVLVVGITTNITSCSSKKEPIKIKCDYCQGSGQCPVCIGSGNCPSCGGSGQCETCRGNGKCKYCNGSGLEPAKCPKCHGYGFLPPKSEGMPPEVCKYCKASGIDPSGKKMPCTHCVVHTDEFMKRVQEGKIDEKKYDYALKNGDFNYILTAIKGIKKGTGKCTDCKGTGKCPSCTGSGKCPDCGGVGLCKVCKGHGHKVDIVICPSCYDTIQYNNTECPHCHTKLKYDGADTSYAKELPKPEL